MKPLIFDATPLIYLTRVGLLRLVEALPTKKYAVQSVFDEVVKTGKSRGHQDALALSRLFDAREISIIEPSDSSLLKTLRRVRGLEEPDAETLAVAEDHSFRAVVDDLVARKVAKTYHVDFVGTPYILVLSIQKRLLTKQEAAKALDDMVDSGWRCGPELYRDIIRIIQHSDR